MLRTCSACLRHVRPDSHACPFCGAAIAAETSSIEAVGRVARIASIGVALTLAACGESTPIAKDAVILPEAGPIATATATASATATATAVATATTTATATTKVVPPPDDWRQHRHSQCTPQGQCPPYGGPPIDDFTIV